MQEDEALQILAKKSMDRVGHDRGCEVYSKAGVMAYIINEIAIESEENVITRGVTKMSKSTQEAIKVFSDSVEKVEELSAKFNLTEKKMEASTKSTIGKVKSSVNLLSDSLSKVEKIADFSKLERYNDTLKGIADSLDRISELQKSGKLESVIKALQS